MTALNDDPDRRARTRRRAALARDEDARRAIYNNRARLLSGVARAALVLLRCRASGPSRTSSTGGGRTRLRGRGAVAKRYLVQVAAYNLGLLMRALLGAGSPRAAADLRPLSLAAGDRLLLVVVAA